MSAEIWKPQPREVYLEWINTISEEASDNLNNWETSFVDSIRQQLLTGRTLTKLQAEKLEVIYVEKTP